MISTDGATQAGEQMPWVLLVGGLAAAAVAAVVVMVVAPRRVRGSLALAVLVLGAAGTGMQAAIRAYQFHLEKLPIHPEGNRQLTAIPVETPSWRRVGSDAVEGAEIVEALGTENYLTRWYVEKEPADASAPLRLQFHAAYYTGMVDTVPHVPERCFVGGGMQKSSSSRVLDVPMDTSSWFPDGSVPPELGGEDGLVYTVRLPGISESGMPYSDLPNGRVRLPRNVSPENPFQLMVSEFENADGSRLYAGYFFIANGGMVASANEVRTLAFDLRSDYAFYCKVQVMGTQASSAEEFAAQAGRLLGELLGEIMRCVPDWTEVQAGRHGAAEGDPV